MLTALLLFFVLGKARPESDVVLFVSHSGNTNECVVAAHQLAARSVPVLVLTGGKGESSYERCIHWQLGVE